MVYWTSWKKTYLKRMGFGFFTTLLMTWLDLISGVFEGTMITFVIAILMYATDIPKMQILGDKPQ